VCEKNIQAGQKLVDVGLEFNCDFGAEGKAVQEAEVTPFFT